MTAHNAACLCSCKRWLRQVPSKAGFGAAHAFSMACAMPKQTVLHSKHRPREQYEQHAMRTTSLRGSTGSATLPSWQKCTSRASSMVMMPATGAGWLQKL